MNVQVCNEMAKCDCIGRLLEDFQRVPACVLVQVPWLYFLASPRLAKCTYACGEHCSEIKVCLITIIFRKHIRGFQNKNISPLRATSTI